ncbi:MAG: hypothetical protein Q9N34_03690 [Aquificota bacterium]|nr:hypothetical protein [Aquificota bacterium]
MRGFSRSIRSEITFLIIVTGFIVGIGVGLFIYKETIDRAVDSARSRIDTTMAFVKASRNYVRKVLRPKVDELLAAGCTKEDFILEAQSSSFFTASIFREVGRNPRHGAQAGCHKPHEPQEQAQRYRDVDHSLLEVKESEGV